MIPRPLSFAHLVKVMEFNSVALVRSPPAPTGCMYFIGSSRADSFFPYSSGPVHHLDRYYEDGEMIPVRLINSLAKHLGIDRDQLWRDADALAGQFSEQSDLSPVRISQKR
jgi:hypothetical protein